ncbi:hypothetical protein [Nostoc sp. C110]|uniref:hypothetical protein n=1 Tax=Nostoc sp. C110 TaxID=3349876 RepID=UPI00370DA5EF
MQYAGVGFSQTEIQWTEHQKAQWKAERQAFKDLCRLIFEQAQPQLIKTRSPDFSQVQKNH